MPRQRIDTERAKLDEEITKNSVKCICSHTMPIPVWKDKEVCTHCGRLMYNNTKAHFKYKLRQMIK